MINPYQSVIDLMWQSKDVDLTVYRHSFLERRIAKRMRRNNCLDISTYLSLLKADAREVDALLFELTVSVSWFFRDSLTIELLKAEIFPEVIASQIAGTGKGLIRIWSAGCARGQEPFSMAILILEVLEKCGRQSDIQIVATDMDAHAIAHAHRAIYTEDDVKNVPYGLLKKYFDQIGGKFQIKSTLKDIVQFSHFNMLEKQHSAPPDAVFGDFDVVICKNVSIYYNEQAREQILGKVTEATTKGGYLILGSSEQLEGIHQNKFIQKFNSAKIFQKY